MSGLASITVLALIPILPAVHSVLVVLALCGSALLAALVGLRHRANWRSLGRFCWRQKWGLFSLGITAWAGVLASAWLIEAVRSAPAEPGAIAGHWSARGGHSRSAALADSLAPTSGGINWSRGPGETFFASPAVVGSWVFAVGFHHDRGRISCWNAETGQLNWTVRPPGFRATFSSPVIVGEMLLIGEGLHHTTDASVYCLDLRAGREGEVLWSYETNSHVECTPVVEGDRVYVAAGDDGVYCLALAPDVEESRRLIWHGSSETYPDVETALAVHDGRVYVGLGAGGEALAVLDAADGSELARLAMPYPVHGLPALVDDRLYLGTGTGNYVEHDQARGQLACVDLKTLEIAWTYDVPGTILDAVVCDMGEVLFGCTDGRLYVLDDHGALLRTWNSHAAILAAPAVTDEMVYIVNTAGVLYGLDRRRLEPVWETRLGPPGQYVSSPVVAHGHVYVGAAGEGFVCAGNPPVETTSTELPARGEIWWTHPFEGRLAAPPAVTDKAILVAVHTEDAHSLLSLINHGHVPPEEVASISIKANPPLSISTIDEIAVVATGSNLIAVDAPTLRILWQVTETTHSAPMIDGGSVWIRTDAQSNASSVLWKTYSIVDGSFLRAAAVAPVVAADNRLHIDGGRIIRDNGDDASGVVWADCSSLGNLETGPIIHNRRVYVGLTDRLVCLGEADRP